MVEDAVQLLRQTYAALDHGDIPAVLTVLNPAVEWHEPGLPGHPPPGGARIILGAAAVGREILAPLIAAWQELSLTPDEFLESGQRVAVVGRFHGRSTASGSVLDVPFVHLWTVRDGTLCRFQDFTDTARVLQALGALPVATP